MLRPAAVLACLAFACLARAGGSEVISPAPDSVSVTIYRDLFALVTETRTVELPEGSVTLSFDGVVETLLPASTVVAGAGRALEERNYDHDQLTPSSLFRRSIGREVWLTRTNRSTGKVSQTPATVVSADHAGVVLRTRDGHEALYCSGLAEAVTFEQIPEGLREKPRLSIRLGAGPAGKRTVRLSYLARGFAWKADYVAHLGERGDRMDLQGWVTLRNLTNASFGGADVQVVAGKLHLLGEDERGTSTLGPTDNYWSNEALREARDERLEELLEQPHDSAEAEDNGPTLLQGCFPTPADIPVNTLPARAVAKYDESAMYETIALASVQSDVAMVREELADYQLYRLPWPTDLGARQTKQALFMDKHGVKAERFYSRRLDAFSGSDEDERAPTLMLGLENRKSDGLGEPLPEGIFRLFEAGPSGALFAGESLIEDKSVGEPLEIPLAHAIDLDLEVRVDRDDDRYRLRDTVTQVARSHVRIANAKSVAVTVEIRQALNGSYNDAKIARASHRTLRKFGDYAWRVRVPANSAGTLDYEIRYTESNRSAQFR